MILIFANTDRHELQRCKCSGGLNDNNIANSIKLIASEK